MRTRIVDIARYVVAYDELGCGWLIDEDTHARMALSHGLRVEVVRSTAPRYAPVPETLAQGQALTARVAVLEDARGV